MTILITGSSGLIGGEAVQYFENQGHTIIGIDNNMRMEFFGPAGDTTWNLNRIYGGVKNKEKYIPLNKDIRDYRSLQEVFINYGKIDAIIHCAAQPSHDKAKDFPLIDFAVNANGTLNLLELTRLHAPDAPFIFMSTNKVYGDAPNELELIEETTRYEYADPIYFDGIKETFRIDQSTHSVFGASKVAADVMVQEYGRYFGLKTCVFRGGCLTGPAHSGVELHGFLSYLVKCVMSGKHYKIYGYKGKQVRDNIHSYDVVKAMEEVIKNPKPGSVYNLGGGRENSVSMLEAISIAEELSGKKLSWEYVDENRVGDHICYISDLSLFKQDYPDWKITKSVKRIIAEIIGSNFNGQATERYFPGDGGDDYFENYASPIEKLCKGKVIDIGCGHGYLTSRISNNSNVEHVIGTDRDNGYKEETKKASYRIINTEDLIQEKSDGFDTIVCTEHIEHLSADLQMDLVEWISKNLNTDGIFLGSMPHHDDPKNPCPYHIKTRSHDEWNSILNQYFTDVQVYKFADESYWWTAKKK